MILTSTTPALATPISDRREQAVRAKAQIDTLRDEAEVVGEQYLDARIAYDSATHKVKTTESKLRVLKKNQTVLETSLDARAENMYRNGRLSMLDVLLGASSFEDFSTAWDILHRMNRDEAASVKQLKKVRADTASAEVVLKKAQAQTKSEFNVMASRKRAYAAKIAKANSLLKGIESEIAQLESAERARERAAAERARQAYSVASAASVDSFQAPTHNANGGVVSIAMQYLGARYVWAASGPTTFDCSGFTMYVYGKVGISLPHSSRAQINSGERVSRADLQPGDLVFFGSPIHHVGMYIGGGQYIHAPSTGDVVKISSLDRGGYAGACRP